MCRAKAEHSSFVENHPAELNQYEDLNLNISQ
jgi:hypothetical protein